MNMEQARSGDSAKRPGNRVRIAIIGVGGAGSNAVDNMIRAGIKGTSFIAINTDHQALCVSQAGKRIQIGSELTKGFGAGANADIGRRAAEECKETLAGLIEETDLVFITAGMGGGTGTGAAPVIAELAHTKGKLTIAFVTTPFAFEGEVRMRNAQMGIANLRKHVDSIVTVPNERLASVAKEMNMTTQRAFQYADDVLRQGVQAITDLIVNTCRVNVDFADIRTILTDGGDTIMGIGRASGSNRAIEAVKKAVNNPVLGTSIEGATRAIINVEGNDIKMDEVGSAVSLVRSVCARGANIIFGTDIVSSLKEEIQVTVIATGFNKGPDQSAAPQGQVEQAARQDRPVMQDNRLVPPVPPVPPVTVPPQYQAPTQMSFFNQDGGVQPAPVPPVPPVPPAPQPQHRAGENGRISLDDALELNWLQSLSRKKRH